MSRNLKIGLAICLLGALIISIFFAGNIAEIFKDYKTSRIFIPVFFIGIVSIWVIQFRIEKKSLEKEEHSK